ncbi:hypothetical protein ABZ667_42190 [Streptomyces lavendulae]|uniref:hypothetical protein n=1 Tax=Streptomyces lavendulae TaxID=1914 RepID=UPI0033EB099A
MDHTVEYVPAPNLNEKWEEGPARIRAACESLDIPSKFLYFNDDFFIMQPIGEIPILNCGSLLHQIKRCKVRSKYAESLSRTYHFLRKCGKSQQLSPLSYELHIPMPVDKGKMLAVIEMTRGMVWPQYRSLYGNIHEMGGMPVGDPKIFSKTLYAPYGPFASTTDISFTQGVIGEQLRAMFPDPCRYEV